MHKKFFTKQENNKTLQIYLLALNILIYSVLFFSSFAFAQSERAEQTPAIKNQLREQYTERDFEIFLEREKNGKIFQSSELVYSPAATDVLVNNNTGSTGTANFTQSETSIIAFGNNILIGFNDSGSYVGGANKFTGYSYSTNSGTTFIDGGTLPTNAGGDAGDPVLARNETTGRIYFSTLGFSLTTIQVFRSDDNGLSWLAPVNGTPGGSSEDKQWITVDNFPGSGNGNVYLMSRRFGGPQGIYFFRSTDHGNTFGPAGGTLIVSDNQGAFVAVGPDHSIYAFWYEGSTGTIKMRKSTDLGLTFSTAVTVVSGLTGPEVNGGLGLTGMRQGSATFNSFRSNSFPHAVVNPVSGHIYCTFNDNPASADKGDVYMVMSSNGGATWSARVRVNDDATTTDQWMPTIAVTPNGNNIGIFYYSRQEDVANNNLFKYYGRTSTIAGSVVTFAPSFAISDVASLPEFGRDNVVNSVYMGDYNHASVTASPNAFHVVWSDSRDDLPSGAPRKDPNVYYEKISLAPSQFLVWDGVLGGQDFSGTYIKNFLTGLSYTVDHTSVFPASLIGYQAVFLCFGMYPANIAFDATKASIVQAYLEAGGRVYLEGNDALEFSQGGNAALHNLFGLGAGSDGGTNVIDGLQGQVGSLTEGMLFSASTQLNNGFIDIYVPFTGKSAFIESGYGDVAVQNSGAFEQKTFCFSYALANLTDGSFPSTKNELMTRILNYLIGPPALPPDINVNPSSLTFSLTPGGSDSDILTITNLGEQTLIWNMIEQDQTTTAAKLKLQNGKELPVSIQPKFDWSQPVKGVDYVPLPSSGGTPPADVKIIPLYRYETFENPVLFGTDAFATETQTLNYVQFDLTNPAVLNNISSFPDWVWAGDFGVDLTFAYAVNSVTNKFIKINKTTGAVTVIGTCAPTQIPGSEFFTGMAIDPTTGVIYLSSTNNSSSWLYTVNPSTGTPSFIGVITNSPLTIAIAINNSGQMYGFDVINDVMVSINKSTAAGTILGALGFDANFGQGMDFDPITGTLYLAAFNNSTFQAELRTANTTTGSTTLIGTLGSTTPGGLLQLGWLGLPGEYFDCTWLTENPVSGLIPGGGNQVVNIYVDATGLTPGTYFCDLIISSNDPANPSIIVPVTLNVIVPPDINVTPTVLTFVVPEGGNDTQLLTIQNTAAPGYGNLSWNLFEQDVVLRAQDGREIPITMQMSSGSNQKISVEQKNSLKIENVNVTSDKEFSAGFEPIRFANKFITNILTNADQTTLTLNNVLLISSGGTPSDIKSYLLGYIPIVDIFDAAAATPTLGLLTAYESVIVMNNIPFLDPIALGNVLADYVDAGGGVVTTLAAFATGYDLQGRFITDGYSPFISGPGPLAGTNLGTFDPNHPIMAGITTCYGSILGDPSLGSGVSLIASWDNGYECVATKGSVAAINIFVADAGYWTGDVPLLLANAANFVGAGGINEVSWISENPVVGTIAAGSSQNIDITVNATGFTGGTYNCNLLVFSNDPDENPVVVPVILVVTSGPPPVNFGIAANALDNNIHIINVDNNTIIGPLLSGNVGSGYLLDPVITPDGQKALISSFAEQKVYFIDIATPYNLSVGGFVNIGFAAEDIVLTPDGAFALVTDGGNSTKVAVINVGTMSLIQTLDIAPREAYAVDIAPNGTVLISDHDNNQIHVLLMNLSTGLLTDLSSAIAVGSGPLNVSIGPDGQTALVANIGATSINVLRITGPGTVVSSGLIPNILNAQSIAFEKNGNRAFVLQTGTTPDALAVLSVTSPGNVIDTGTRVNLISNANSGLYGVDVIDVSKDGDWAYVGNPDAFFPNTNVAVVDLTSYTLATNLTAGNYPTGIAITGSNTFQLSVNVSNGWNMVSIPGLNTPDQNINTWWAFRDPGANVFRYSGGYQTVTDAVPGTGYWMKHAGARTYNTGEEWPAGGIQIVAHAPLTAASGWNLFGGYELVVTAANVTTNPPGQQSGPIYKYSGGYQVATTLDPGYGYWIKLLSAAQIIIPETMAKGEVVEYFPEAWGRIILTDATGINYTLYAVKGQVDLSQYELPPAPPTGMFDIRYNSGRIAEDINSAIKTIDMSGVTYPLTVRVEGMDIRLMDETGKAINVNLKAGEDIVISDASVMKLMVSGELIPAQYSLEQNYPNPFNPSTVIEFSLPEDVSNVKLSIYNALGERVAELVNTSLTAGKYQYQWSAGNVATGMYIYELRTEKFVSVKKMILMK